MADAEATESRALAPKAAAELIGGGQLVDVRGEAEYEAGHIGDALNVPLHRLDTSVAGDLLDPSKPVVFYCRGGDRSAAAAEAFGASGWDAYSIDGGLLAWAEASLPLEGEVAERSRLPGA